MHAVGVQEAAGRQAGREGRQVGKVGKVGKVGRAEGFRRGNNSAITQLYAAV